MLGRYLISGRRRGCILGMVGQANTARRFSGAAWLLAGGAAILLVALWLWSEKLYPAAVPAEAKKPVKSEPLADGGPQAGERQPLAFDGESCRPWNISAALSPPKNVPVVFVTSRLSDPHGLVLAGLAAECGPPVRVLEVDKAAGGELGQIVAESRPAVLAAVGLAAAQLAEREAPGIPLLFAEIPNPVAAGFDRPGAAGVSPWVPPEPLLQRLLDVLPAGARLALFHPAGRLEAFTLELSRLIKQRGRELHLYPLKAELMALLSRAAQESDAWLVLCDRSSNKEEFFEPLLVQAERLKVPLAVSDEEHVRRGALLGVGTDSYRIGKQLCRLAGALVSGRLPPEGRVFCPEYSFTVVHLARAEKLGYLIDPAHTPQLKVYQWH